MESQEPAPGGPGSGRHLWSPHSRPRSASDHWATGTTVHVGETSRYEERAGASPQTSHWPIPHFRNSFLKEQGLQPVALAGASRQPQDSTASEKTPPGQWVVPPPLG